MAMQKNGITIGEITNNEFKGTIECLIGSVKILVRFYFKTGEFDTSNRSWTDGRRFAGTPRIYPTEFREMMRQVAAIARDRHWGYKEPT